VTNEVSRARTNGSQQAQSNTHHGQGICVVLGGVPNTIQPELSHTWVHSTPDGLTKT
jgi:hypothetical protein